MSNPLSWSRRGTLAGLAAGIAGPAFADEPETPDAGAFLETAFDQARRLLAQVWINGKGPFSFVIDTGANSSVISREVATICGLPAAGSASIHGIVSVETAPLVKVSRLRVGDVLSAGLSLPTVPAAKLGGEGILGLDAMRGRRVVLGFQDQTFQISPSVAGAQLALGRNTRIPAHLAPVTVPARFRAGQLVILDAEAAGKGITAFLDSGSQVTIANLALRALVRGEPTILGQPVIRSDLISATGQRISAEFAPLSGLRLGGQRLGAPLVAFADLHIFSLWDLNTRPTVLIGVDVLRRFDKVGFDFGHKTVTFWPRRPSAL